MSEIASTIASACRAAGRGNPGNLAQCSAGSAGHDAGDVEHHRCTAWRRRDRISFDASAVRGAVAVRRKRAAQARSQQVPGLRPGRINPCSSHDGEAATRRRPIAEDQILPGSQRCRCSISASAVASTVVSARWSAYGSPVRVAVWQMDGSWNAGVDSLNILSANTIEASEIASNCTHPRCRVALFVRSG